MDAFYYEGCRTLYREVAAQLAKSLPPGIFVFLQPNNSHFRMLMAVQEDDVTFNVLVSIKLPPLTEVLPNSVRLGEKTTIHPRLVDSGSNVPDWSRTTAFVCSGLLQKIRFVNRVVC